MLAIEGAIVTIDAMGCQRAIADKIVEKKTVASGTPNICCLTQWRSAFRS
jgi:predicted transposase YbfD/YdcC